MQDSHVCGETLHRLGPLAVEQKKRVLGKRAKFEKNKADERRPQELREEDIARSENETTKHVIDVGPVPFFYKKAVFPFHFIDSQSARGAERAREPFQIHHQPARLCAIRREPVLPFLFDQGWRMRARN